MKFPNILTNPQTSVQIDIVQNGSLSLAGITQNSPLQLSFIILWILNTYYEIRSLQAHQSKTFVIWYLNAANGKKTTRIINLRILIHDICYSLKVTLSWEKWQLPFWKITLEAEVKGKCKWLSPSVLKHGGNLITIWM